MFNGKDGTSAHSGRTCKLVRVAAIGSSYLTDVSADASASPVSDDMCLGPGINGKCRGEHGNVAPIVMTRSETRNTTCSASNYARVSFSVIDPDSEVFLQV